METVDKHLVRQWVGAGLVVLGLILVILGAILGYIQWQKSEQVIPSDINKQVSFVIFWPYKAASAIPDKTTLKYDATNKLLSYLAYTSDKIKLTISEQSSPEVFSDVPQAYDKFTSDLQQYSSFDSLSGKVYLTHPKELKGGQTAVMNVKGTLVFVRPDKNLSDDTWRNLFNNLQVFP